MAVCARLAYYMPDAAEWRSLELSADEMMMLTNNAGAFYAMNAFVI